MTHSHRIDLHTHSNHSDGRDNVSQLVAAAAEAGLSALALTDHDTTAGWAECRELCRAAGIGFVPGIEVTTRATVLAGSGASHSFGVHLLAYLPDPTDLGLAAVLATSVSSRVDRLREIVERVAADFAVEWADVEAQLSVGATAGRPALADALISRGHFVNRGEVFDRLFYRGNPYFVPNTGVPDTLSAIELIRHAGGVPVIAHPMARGGDPGVADGAGVRGGAGAGSGGAAAGREMPERHFAEMIEAGLAGFEVHHRDVPQAAREWLLGLAERKGLIVTGSSDYHGLAGKPNRLGEFTTAPEMLERIIEQSDGRVLASLV